MSLANLLTRTVTILSAPVVSDRYNNATPDWSNATETAAQAWLAQTGTLEDHEQRDATATTVSATFAAGTVLGAYDRVVVDGLTYEIDGLPNVAYTPRGPHHVEATLRLVVG